MLVAVGDAVGVAVGEGVGVGVGEAVGAGVGDGVGVALGEGDGVMVGDGVGAAAKVAEGPTVGVDVGAAGAEIGASEAPALGDGWITTGLALGATDGDTVGAAVTSDSGALSRGVSRVRLNPARARPTASDGPRRTYKVNEVRPPWPDGRFSKGLLPRAPTLVCGSYPASKPDKWRQRCKA